MERGLKFALFFSVVFVLSVSFISAGFWSDFFSGSFGGTGDAIKNADGSTLLEIQGKYTKGISGSVICVDTDGGTQHFVQGNTYNNETNFTDFCYTSTNILREGYCSNGEVIETNFTCPVGCSNGACFTNSPCVDNDADGYSPTGGLCGKPIDCHDNAHTTYPGAPEVCNGIDDDCDGQIDEGPTCNVAPTCFDSDGGENVLEGGVTSYMGANYTDYCYPFGDAEGVVEYVCSDNVATSAFVSCPSGYSCYGGKCVEEGTYGFDLQTVLEFSTGDVQVGEILSIIKHVSNIGDIDGYITGYSSSTCLPGSNISCSGGGGGFSGIPIAAGETLLYYENYTFNQSGVWQINRSYSGEGINGESDVDLTNNLFSALYTVAESGGNETCTSAVYNVTEGQTLSVQFDGAWYNVSLAFVEQDSAIFVVNGENTNSLSEGESYALSNGVIIRVEEIFYNSQVNVSSVVTFSLSSPECGSGTCTDTDGGIDYYEVGFATDDSGTINDGCIIGGVHDGWLREAICTGDSATWTDYQCPLGCSSGACIQSNVTTLNPFYLVYGTGPNASYLDQLLLANVQTYLEGRPLTPNSILIADPNVTKQDVLNTVSVLGYAREFMVVYPDSPNLTYLYAIEAGNTLSYIQSYLDSHPSYGLVCAEIFPSSQIPGDNLIDTLTLCENWYEPSYLCADANGDGFAVNILDLNYLVNYIFRGGVAPEPLIAGDQNADGDVNILDLNYLVNYIFRNGTAPICPPTSGGGGGGGPGGMSAGTDEEFVELQDSLLDAGLKSRDVGVITGKDVPFPRNILWDLRNLF